MSVSRTIKRLALLSLLCTLPACVTARTSAKRATDVDPKRATVGYWLERPAVAKATGGDFDRLWNAAEAAARDRRFEIDQADRRSAVLTTLPLQPKEFIEVWRNDTPRFKDQLRNTVAEYRRSIRYEFSRTPDGAFQVEPRVVVERHAEREHRVTAAVYYGSVFYLEPRQLEDYSADRPQNPPDYWYATGRDHALERELAREIEKRAKGKSS